MAVVAQTVKDAQSKKALHRHDALDFLRSRGCASLMEPFGYSHAELNKLAADLEGGSRAITFHLFGGKK